MTKKLELYKCSICRNLVEVVLEGEGELVCCGEVMELMSNDNHTGSTEAHRPIIESYENKKTVRIEKKEPVVEQVKEELADVMNYCLQLAQVLNVDVIDIVNAKMDKTEKKYPVNKAKGVATKYNKL